MLIPLDPNGRTGLWDALEVSIERDNLIAIVSSGQITHKLRHDAVNNDQGACTVRRMRNLSYVRVGTERLMPLPPHFAVSLADDGFAGALEEYLARDASIETTLRDMTLLIDLVFFEVKSLKKLIIPFDASHVPVEGFDIHYDLVAGRTQVSR